MAAVDLRRFVADRSRNLAEQARARAERAAFGLGDSASTAPPWLSRLVGYLPERAQQALRDALGPDEAAARAREQLAAVRREKEDLRNRESALDGARADLHRAHRALEETRLELRAREHEAERLLAQARRAAAEVSVERLVPRNEVRWDPQQSPRPIRGVARLAANIKRFGQLTPVTVRPLPRGGYALVTGYRRMAALAQAGVPHARVRVLPEVDDATAAALYVAENCLVDGVSSKAVQKLAERVGDLPGFAEVLPLVQADDEAATEEVYLDDMAEEARSHLAEGAAWVATLRPYWADLEPADRGPLEELIVYFARVAARLGP